ncbi:MAG: DUF1800 domain-containing protein [Gammaproteobacteria bacterium]|nr:DUF1800 domain-containing protein [Gammaproteobacteria bacterium]MYH84209.1 DUF1800 domain-containing protein [Gammaproteobacteria bacterium]MYK03953.1 DUF1800 domain-containing protein [Gammaproteobacteria bacterium]
MRRFLFRFSAVSLIALAPLAANGDFEPISPIEWNEAKARHLLERAGFGARPEEVAEFAAMTPAEAVRRLVYFEGAPDVELPGFDHSGVFDEGLDPFPPSRPATTELARRQGHALGIQVKPGGDRPLQPVVNKFFYWLRASRLETDRVAYWWAERMLNSPRPLEEKMALFWHGHFATNENKVRDYRKMLKQLNLFQEKGLGDFRGLLIGVAQDPAMLNFLDAGVNTRGSPNENFAREIMELFTMGVGNYGESDVREAARAFTGWNYEGLEFTVVTEDHDFGVKRVLGREGDFDGVEVIDIILEQDATAEFIARKIYNYFVSEELDDDSAGELGAWLKDSNYDIAAYMEHLFLSRDFYRDEVIGSRIKGPVEYVVSTYRLLGLDSIPGTPDFNRITGSLGQRLMHPPTVAGWSEGRAWITPSLLFERGNFVLDVVFPDIAFLPPDRHPGYGGEGILSVHERLRRGMDISAATLPPMMAEEAPDMSELSASNMLADSDEAFNTRYGSYRGWQMAIERVKPIPRDMARVDLAAMVTAAGLQTPIEVVDYLTAHFFTVPPEPATIAAMAEYLEAELGTADIAQATSFMEESMRGLLHVLLSRPEYQLN